MESKPKTNAQAMHRYILFMLFSFQNGDSRRGDAGGKLPLTLNSFRRGRF